MKEIFNYEILKHEFIIKKSRFITYVKKIKSKSDLNSFINEFSDPSARHNCYAYRYITDSGLETQGYDNNGEPGGTSGDALLRLIELKNITNICVLVVRFFGGIKLGAGLLSRSYIEGSKELLSDENLVDYKKNIQTKISFEIKNQKKVLSFLNKNCLDYKTNYRDNFVDATINHDNDINFDEISHLITRGD